MSIGYMRGPRICVSITEDGKAFRRSLMYGEDTICDLSPVDLIELIMQATSSLRYDVPKVRDN
ncbi:hypothetical protein [Aerobium aerolatum]|uniref:Uncharacterized protein n=1 Tax=Aquamicrobium aerolatum DSM 21857 TaxID=1121003 RepID=A0A1I3L8J3_9HYPH|nr:hypothetical protein [Aquamicrobium aerolatum]SFI81073.1 hypothetical protein SAMN03080618_01426 [Aquamicrobium aerolatum DSM 21857]